VKHRIFIILLLISLISCYVGVNGAFCKNSDKKNEAQTKKEEAQGLLLKGVEKSLEGIAQEMKDEALEYSQNSIIVTVLKDDGVVKIGNFDTFDNRLSGFKAVNLKVENIAEFFQKNFSDGEIKFIHLNVRGDIQYSYLYKVVSQVELYAKNMLFKHDKKIVMRYHMRLN